MKSSTGKLLITIGAISLALLLAVAAVSSIREFWQTPLGPELGFDEQAIATPQNTAPSPITPQPEPPPVVDDSETAVPSPPPATPASEDEDIPTAVAFPTYTPAVYCGEDTEMIILAAGLDNRSNNLNYKYGRADVIRVVRVDFTVPSVSVLAFPRDLWVQIPDAGDITEAKLNQSYFFGNPDMGYYKGPGGGVGLLARTLDLNYGVQPEHYGVVNMVILEEIINAIGGVDIYLEKTLDARDSPESDDLWKIYEAGWNHLDGKRAVYYGRIRKTDNVFGRMDRQSEILCAVKNKLLSPSAVMGIPDMIAAFYNNVYTDLSPAQLSQLACLAPKLKWENISFARFPENELHGTMIDSPNMNNREFIFDVDNQRIREYVAGFLAGTWPPPADEDDPADANRGQTQMLCPAYPDQ